MRGTGKAGWTKGRRAGAVGGDDAAEELLSGAGGGRGELGEEGLHGGEEARGGELGDDEVLAAEGVAERGGAEGVAPVGGQRKRRRAAAGSGSRRRAAAKWYDENLLLGMAGFGIATSRRKKKGKRGDAAKTLQAPVEEAGAVRGRVRAQHLEEGGVVGGEEGEPRPGASLCEGQRRRRSGRALGQQ